MKKQLSNYLVLILSLASGFCHSQQLIPNGGFESYSGCPDGAFAGGVDSLAYWVNPTNYGTTQLGGSPDYFNACALGYLDVPQNYAGMQNAWEGAGYCGIIVYSGQPPQTISNFREYLETPLALTLGDGKCYHLELRVNVSDFMQYSAPDLQAYFSDTLITGVTNSNPLPYIPQVVLSGAMPDTAGWVLYSGNYVATGTENFLVIGNFHTDATTSAVLSNPNGMWAYGYTYIDGVSLLSCDPLSLDEHAAASVSVYPNPATDQLMVEGLDALHGPTSITLLSSEGTVIREAAFDGSMLDISYLANGVYFLLVTDANGTVALRFVKQD